MSRLASLLLLAACTGAANTDSTTYAFERDGEATVSYTGQTFRHLLVADLASYLDGLTEQIDRAETAPAAGTTAADVDFYLSFDSTLAGSLPLAFEATLPLEQSTYDDVSSGKNLLEKLAGNDTVTDHRDWSTAFVGLGDASSPELLVREWVEALDAQATAWKQGPPLAPDGSPVPRVTMTATGKDLGLLLRTFLLGAIAYSQATDDYLDDDVDGKGLLSDHSAAAEGKPYTELEHAWDEGFGYFGAAASAGGWTLASISEGHHDADGSGSIDLFTEVCWGSSGLAAERQLHASDSEALFDEVWSELYAGRAVIADARGPLTERELDALRSHRDAAVAAWERAHAATLVHFLNGTLAQTRAIGSGDYDYVVHTEQFSQLAGHALALQFNPHSALSEEAFAELMQLIGTAPALTGAEAEAYASDLIDARTLLANTFEFADADLGGDDGAGGW